MKHLSLLPAIAFTTVVLLAAASLAAQSSVSVPVRCDPAIPNCCSSRCGDDETCLCECYLATGQSLREQERYADAVKHLQVAARLCPESGAQALIDSIYQEQRIWVYQGGKFAIATPLGEMVTPFVFPNSPEPFKKGVAIFSDENGKYFFTDKNGNTLTPKPGYDGIIPTEGGVYFLKRGDNVSFTTEKGLSPCYQNSYSGKKAPTLNEIGYWRDPSALYNFAQKTAGKYDYMEGYFGFHRDLAKVRKVGRSNQYQNIEGGLWGLIDTASREITPLIYENIEAFSNGFFQVKKDNKTGLLDKEGRPFLPLEYDDLLNFGGDFFIFRQKEKWGVMDTSGEVVITPIYSYISSDNSWEQKFQYGMTEAGKKDSLGTKTLSGVVDTSGKEIIPFEYEKIKILDSNLFIVKQNGKWGLIERSGKVTIPLQYSFLEKIYDNHLLANKNGIGESDYYWNIEGGKWGLLDKNGREVIPIVYDGMENYAFGWLKVKNGNKYGLMDASGQIVLPAEYEEISETFTGHFFGVKQQGKWGGVDMKGKNIIPCIYDNLNNLAWEKIIKVEKDSLQGLLDFTGRIILPVAYQNIGNYLFGDTFTIKKNGLWGWMDVRSREIVPAVYQEFGSMSDEGFMTCKKNGLWGLLDSFGREAILPRYDSVTTPIEGLIWAKKQGKWFFLDTQGQKIVPLRPVYDYAWPFDIWGLKNNVAWVKSKGKFGLVNRVGKEIVSPIYATASFFDEGITVVAKGKNILLIDTLGKETNLSDYSEVDISKEGMIWVKRDSLWGCIDKFGLERIPFLYQKAIGFFEGVTKVKKNNRWGFVNKHGEAIVKLVYDGTNWSQKGFFLVNLGGKSNNSGDTQGGFWGIVDTMGKEVLPIEYENITAGQTDRFWVKKDGVWHFIDKNRRDLIPPTNYDEVYLLSASSNECYYAVKKKDLWGWIDQNGKEIVAPFYEDFIGMTNGIARVMKNKRWALLDSTGRELISGAYENIGGYSDEITVIPSQKHGIWTLTESNQVEFDQDLIKYCLDPRPYEGLFWVQKNSKWGLIDTAEQEMLPPTYDLGFIFHDGLAKVRNYSKYGFVNKKGKEVVPCILDRYHISGENQYLLIANDKKGLLFTQELTYIPPEYDEIAQNEDPDPAYPWIMVMKNDQWGWVNHKGEVQIPCRYDAATPFNKEGWATVLQFGLQFRINRKGEMIWEKE